MTRVPYVVAHRGVSAVYPENTLSAFQAAVALEVDWIELDVVTTSDGGIIVSHDRTADRCTDGTGLFKTKSLDEVKRLDAGIRFGEQFAGERIPTLDEVISLVEETSVRLCIEIKGDTPDDTLANARATVTLLQQRDFLQRTAISSFEPNCLRAIREWEPLLAINLDPMPQNGTLSPWKLCQQCLRCGANFISHTYEYITPVMLAEARAHGLALWAWTVNDAESMRRMIDLEVDAILTDDPATLKAILSG
jgi:glycerophosphoryl diester phosphodiesterase